MIVDIMVVQYSPLHWLEDHKSLPIHMRWKAARESLMEMSVGMVCVTCHADIEEVVGRGQRGDDHADLLRISSSCALKTRMPVSRADVGKRA